YFNGPNLANIQWAQFYSAKSHHCNFVSNVTIALYSVCNNNTTDGGVSLHSQVGGIETTITDGTISCSNCSQKLQCRFTSFTSAGWHDENAVGFVYLNDRHCETSHEVDIRGAENTTGFPDATVDERSTMDSTPLLCQTETVVSIDSKASDFTWKQQQCSKSIC
ncbi:unnamed protein product, partial [Brassica rapa]